MMRITTEVLLLFTIVLACLGISLGGTWLSFNQRSDESLEPEMLPAMSASIPSASGLSHPAANDMSRLSDSQLFKLLRLCDASAATRARFAGGDGNGKLESFHRICRTLMRVVERR